MEAFKAYKQTDPQDAVRVLQKAISQFTLRGQFRRAANHQMDLGAMYENDLDDAKQAVTAYETAGDWYYQDQAEALSNKAFLKVAELAGLNGDYPTAIENFDRVAKQSLNNSLTKWSLKEYFLKAGLCRLADKDVVSAERALEQYQEWDPNFGTTRECQLLKDVTEAVKNGDQEAVANASYDFHQFSKLDRFKTEILMKIKEQITSADDDLL